MERKMFCAKILAIPLDMVGDDVLCICEFMKILQNDFFKRNIGEKN